MTVPLDRVRGFGPLLHRTRVIWRLEAAQMLRPGAIVWAVGLSVLPAGLLTAMRTVNAVAGEGDIFEAPGVIDAAMFALIPGVVCLLGLLLTATSAVQSEIENRTWIYLAVRPQAKLAALLGKYLFAVSWVMAIATTASIVTFLVLTGGVVPPATVARTVALSLLSCLSYGALYLFIGVAFLRVGMVVAIAYTLLVEGLLGGVPAVVNEATIAYHLRLLFLRGLPDQIMEEIGTFLGDTSGPAAIDIAVVLGITALFLGGRRSVQKQRQAAAVPPD